MIRRSSEVRLEFLENLKGGKNTVQWNHFVEKDEMYGAGRLFNLSIIPPGGSIGKHVHEGEYEIYYILKGKALIDDNGIVCELNPGDMNLCNDGEYHAIENIGGDNLEYVAAILFNKLD